MNQLLVCTIDQLAKSIHMLRIRLFRFVNAFARLRDGLAGFAFLALCSAMLVAATLGGTVVAQSQEAERADPAIAFAGRIVGNNKRFRLLLDFDREIDHKTYVLNNPKRLIIDLSETVFSLDEQALKSPSSLVSDTRYGTIAPGKSRIVMELTGPVKVSKSEFKAIGNGKKHRLIVDTIISTEAQFAKIAKSSVESKARGKISYKGDRVARPKKEDRIFTVVIDPGHGGIDGGATGKHRTREKNITLQFSLALRKKLQRNPSFKVLLTREDDTFVSLQDRIDFAHRNHANLMISVHADSLRQRSIRGATVYTLSEEGTDELSRQLAKKQNRADLVAGLDLPKVDASVTDILIDLTRRETEVFSSRFARMLVTQMKNDIKLIKNPHRSADFFVLKAADIPSVLLELGYLSNAKDEALMASPKWQEKAAERLTRATIRFFDNRMVAQ